MLIGRLPPVYAASMQVAIRRFSKNSQFFHAKPLLLQFKHYDILRSVVCLQESGIMSDSDQPSDPFADFINHALDMNGINGLDQVAISTKLRSILQELPANITPDLWNDQLDSLQAIIRLCLDLDTVLHAFEDHLDMTSFSRDDLEVLVMLSVTFSFVAYNRMHPAYNVEEQYSSDTTLLARRLRDTLLAAMGWVKRAAREGDPIARKFLNETGSLLDASQGLD
jgi:hypothetical protein